MIAPPQLVELAKRFEGFSAKAYLCPAGYWTIGYGHLCDKGHPPITEEQGEAYLTQDLQTALTGTLKYCPGLALEGEDKLSAIADFTFNLGIGRLQASTLRRRVDDKDWDGAATELLRWVYGGGRVLPGLIRRRMAERELLSNRQFKEQSTEGSAPVQLNTIGSAIKTGMLAQKSR